MPISPDFSLLRNSFYGFNKSLRGYNFSPRGPFNYSARLQQLLESRALSSTRCPSSRPALAVATTTPMLNYLVRRLLLGLVTLVLITFLVYGLIRNMPGTPLTLEMGEDPSHKISEEDQERM